MKHFVLVSHTVDPSGAWELDDLAGGAGRVDVLCRAITMALFTSHGIRADTDVTLVFTAGEPSAVRISGASVNRLNPDERSTAARIRNAQRHPHPDPWWHDVEPGIQVAPMDLAEVLDDLAAPVLWLDQTGVDIMADTIPAEATWVLSDHQPFSEAEVATIRQRATGAVSLGDTWYHGHHVIGVVQFLLDRQAT